MKPFESLITVILSSKKIWNLEVQQFVKFLKLEMPCVQRQTRSSASNGSAKIYQQFPTTWLEQRLSDSVTTLSLSLCPSVSIQKLHKTDKKGRLTVQHCRQIHTYQDNKINGLEISYKQKPANKTAEIQTGGS